MSKPFVSRHPVRFSHTDPASYVFFPRYFEMIQGAVEDWFNDALGVNYAELVNEQRLGLPTARIECEFLHPSRLGETLGIKVYVERLGRTSLQVLFVGAVHASLRLRARSVLVVIGLDDGRPQEIPAPLREQMEAYAKRQGEVPQADLRPRDAKAQEG